MSLVGIFIEKEKIYWKRTWEIRKKLNWIGVFFAIALLTIIHYAMTFMSFITEFLLWIFWKDLFISNMKKMKHSLKSR